MESKLLEELDLYDASELLPPTEEALAFLTSKLHLTPEEAAHFLPQLNAQLSAEGEASKLRADTGKPADAKAEKNRRDRSGFRKGSTDKRLSRPLGEGRAEGAEVGVRVRWWRGQCAAALWVKRESAQEALVCGIAPLSWLLRPPSSTTIPTHHPITCRGRGGGRSCRPQGGRSVVAGVLRGAGAPSQGVAREERRGARFAAAGEEGHRGAGIRRPQVCWHRRRCEAREVVTLVCSRRLCPPLLFRPLF